jgi:hypothetical protein
LRFPTKIVSIREGLVPSDDKIAEELKLKFKIFYSTFKVTDSVIQLIQMIL